ncbi:elongator complex protein 3 [Acetanaerobacterium elongatum]|uniref:Radical SAM superfamily protein n=1 Tax=Acetanaerobacterium elongatum TaxID=258515 RepID=A0A1H0DLU1_9FIRM|nr:radical SAM protein [Acetanaerobacterium elongatum]SDN70961.1 Radical SAM superfamily protein [Acetanaerobacterium elongatum]
MRHANVALFVPHLGCPHCCSFCNQRSISGSQEPTTPAMVRKACDIACKSLGDRVKDAEIAFFGGSFTAIERDVMISLLKEAKACIDELGFMGIRCSTRPDAIDDEVLGLLKQNGVTSIELGAQSLNDEVLRKNNRGHTAKQVKTASHMIKQAGFSLGLQMMVGLYGGSEAETLKTAQGICELKPDTVRIYPTIVMKGTELERLYREGLYTPLSLDETVDLCAQCLTLFEQYHIKVIRVGLHAEEELRQGMVAGPFHPAFRELCESRLMLQKLKDELQSRNIPQGDVTVRVSPKAVSKLIGQHKINVEILKELNYNLTVYPDETVVPNEFTIDS